MHRRAVPVLIAALKDADEEMAMAVVKALAKLTGAKVEKNTHEAWQTWYEKQEKTPPPAN